MVSPAFLQMSFFEAAVDIFCTRRAGILYANQIAHQLVVLQLDPEGDK